VILIILITINPTVVIIWGNSK